MIKLKYCLVFLFAGGLFAQMSGDSRTGIGASFGTSYLIPGFVNTQYIYTGLLFYPDPYNLSIQLFLSDHHSGSLNISYGYSFAKGELDYAYASLSYDRQITYRTIGHPLEIEYIIGKPLAAQSIHTPFLGLGIGYYDYNTRIRVEVGEDVANSNLKISGLAQFFTIGWQTKLTEKHAAFIRLRKLGVSGLTVEEDLVSYQDSDYIGLVTRKSVPSIGTTDFGIELGVRLSFK